MLPRQATIRENLALRARVMAAVREFFNDQGFLEVEVPCRVPAPLPEAHVDAVPSGAWFLAASPEDLMKRLLSAGYPKIYTVARAFRGNERGRLHLPELSLLEWYRSGADYRALMDDCEELVSFAAATALDGRPLCRDGQVVDLSRPWPRISVAEAFIRWGGMDVAEALRQDDFDRLMAFAVEPALPRDRPVFLTDYPAEKAAFARRSQKNPAMAERFELYLCGVELANAFSELRNPDEQRARFETENAQRKNLGKPVYPPPERFLESLARMPEAAGIALGLDRLAMVLADAPDIDSVCAFTPEEL